MSSYHKLDVKNSSENLKDRQVSTNSMSKLTLHLTLYVRFCSIALLYSTGKNISSV
jgi:hypothetical protein